MHPNQRTSFGLEQSDVVLGAGAEGENLENGALGWKRSKAGNVETVSFVANVVVLAFLHHFKLSPEATPMAAMTCSHLPWLKNGGRLRGLRSVLFSRRRFHPPSWNSNKLFCTHPRHSHFSQNFSLRWIDSKFQAGAIWGLCMSPYDASKKGDKSLPLLHQSKGSIEFE